MLGSGNQIQATLLFEGHFLLVIYFPCAQSRGVLRHTPTRTNANVHSGACVCRHTRACVHRPAQRRDAAT